MIRIIKSRSMKLEGNIARMGETETRTCRWEDKTEINLPEKSSEDANWTPGSELGPVVDSCKQGNKASSSIKKWQFTE
jgi:hypothetical protein